MKSNSQRVALITGSARRIGAVIAEALHAEDWNVIIHYRYSEKEALALCQKLNQKRTDSACALKSDFKNLSEIEDLGKHAFAVWNRLDVLVNNASDFFKTEVGTTTEEQWHALMDSNLKAPYFLSQQVASFLRQTKGCIINIADIHGIKPLKKYPVYSIAKAGLIMLTKALALELAPDIRVNAIALGPSLSPEGENAMTSLEQNKLLEKTLLKKLSTPQEIAESVIFLLQQKSMTGEMLKIDAGRLL